MKHIYIYIYDILFQQVICMVADGASSNRSFFAYHAIEQHKRCGITYKAPNLTLPGQFVYLMVDVPHLMKITRNAWSNLQAKGTRHLEVMFHMYIIYTEFMVYRTTAKKSSGCI